MKPLYLILGLTVLAMASCARDEDERANNLEGELGDVKEEVREAGEAAQAYAARTKDELLAGAKQELDQLDARLQEWERKAETKSEEARAEARQTLAALKEKRKKVAEQFEEIQNSSGEAWKEVKSGFEAAMADFRKAFREAKGKFD